MAVYLNAGIALGQQKRAGRAVAGARGTLA
jgi:hypothetical protein